MKNTSSLTYFVGNLQKHYENVEDLEAANMQQIVRIITLIHILLIGLLAFLDQRKQRVVVDGYRTKYVSINRGVP